MPVVFKREGKTVDIDDIPLAIYGEIQKETGIAWYELTTSPVRHAIAGEMLAKECAKVAGVELPPLTPRLLVEVFEVVNESNTPTEYEDGMPDPKAKGSDQETS